MRTLNRVAVVIKPKEPYYEWTKTLGNVDSGMTLEDHRKDCTVILTPAYETQAAMVRCAQGLAREIFRRKLWEWHRDETYWPKELGWCLFKEWFDFEIHTMIVDGVENEPHDWEIF